MSKKHQVLCSLTVALGFLVVLLLLLKTTGDWVNHRHLPPSRQGLLQAFLPLGKNSWERGNVCWIPALGFRAWRGGLVTELMPVVQRNCTKLIAHDEKEISWVKEKLKTWKSPWDINNFRQNISNCLWVREYFTENLYITKLEKSFPIGFNFLIHNSPEQVIRMLRYLYRPHNLYCIHPDKKASKDYIKLFRSLASCLNNIIVPEELVNVTWGHSSIMEAQMLCLKQMMDWRDLRPEHEKWKYIINICGKELPMATTHDIVTKLIRLNGSSSFLTKRVDKKPGSVERLRGKEVPFGLPFYKSMTYGAISYKFANFLLTNETALTLFEFFKGCFIPEEHFYPTAFMIPGVPGGYDPKFENLYFGIDAYFWLTASSKRKHCGGINVHAICVVSVEELGEILQGERGKHVHVFHNKYFQMVDHVVMDCMEEMMVARNRLEYQQDCPGRLSTYQIMAWGKINTRYIFLNRRPSVQ